MEQIKKQGLLGRQLLIIALLVALFGSASGQTNNEGWKSLKEFREDERKAYDDLRFLDVNLKVNGVRLRSVPYGYAFAYFDKEDAQRWLLVNERLLYQQFDIERTGIEASDASEPDKTKKIKVLQERTLDKIRGLIVHEWSHHFLGHTFERISRLNERDADIMTGRILYEFYNRDNLNEQQINIDGLNRSLEVTNFFATRTLDRFHLPKDARSILIQKGYDTAWLLNLLKRIPQKLMYEDELKKSETARKIDSLRYLIDIKKYQEIKDITQRSNKLKKDSISTFERSKSIRQDSMNKLSIIRPIALYIARDLSADSNLVAKIDSIRAKITVDSTKLNKLISKISEENLHKIQEKNRKASDTFNDLSEQLKKELNSKVIDYKSDVYEPFYNVFYLKGNIFKGIKNQENLYDKILLTYKRKNSEDTLMQKPLYFSLKGSVQFVILVSKEKISFEQQNKKEIKLLASDKQKFLYKFKIDDSDYYLDENYNLWTKTIGAPAIDDMLFLQPYKLSRK